MGSFLTHISSLWKTLHNLSFHFDGDRIHLIVIWYLVLLVFCHLLQRLLLNCF